MKNKFTLKEGEVQRILGLHKQAILKENKIILSEGHKLSLISADGWNPSLPKTWNLKSFKIIKKVGDFIKVSAVDSGGGQYNNIEISCKNKNMLTIKTDGPGSDGNQNEGTTYQLGSDLIKLVTEKCGGSKKSNEEPKKSNEGSSSLGGSYKQLRQQDFIPLPTGKNKASFTTPKDIVWKGAGQGVGAVTKKEGQSNIGFLCNGYLSPKNVAYNFMYDKTWYRNKEFGSFLRKKFCGSKTETDDKKDDGTSDNKNDNNSKNNLKVKGNRYTFDFDTVMKAITDTGKCPAVSGSSDGASGSSGSSGTSGVQGTSGIQNPVPINNKISKELYYKIIAP